MVSIVLFRKKRESGLRRSGAAALQSQPVSLEIQQDTPQGTDKNSKEQKKARVSRADSDL